MVTLCYSCKDDVDFRMHGLTDEFNPAKSSKEYIESLQALDCNMTVKCELCGRTVQYLQSESGRWRENVISYPEYKKKESK